MSVLLLHPYFMICFRGCVAARVAKSMKLIFQNSSFSCSLFSAHIESTYNKHGWEYLSGVWVQDSWIEQSPLKPGWWWGINQAITSCSRVVSHWKLKCFAIKTQPYLILLIEMCQHLLPQLCFSLHPIFHTCLLNVMLFWVVQAGSRKCGALLHTCIM